MSSDLAIKIENISKQYKLGEVGTGTLSHDINRWWSKIRGKEDPYLKIGETNVRAKKGESDYVWAIKNISLEVKRGEILGIIGQNGAGKSTLLKLLSKVTAPTTGTIKYKGRIASLLEVGTGFHPELTGKENVFLNGAILGMTKAEIKARLDDIVEFAGVARYIDTPVKRYSSGMRVRLGFSIAAHLSAEILIIDEVLAVGDALFQKKAIEKMKEISEGANRTIILVSHNMGSIEKLCTRCMVLKDGILDMMADPQTAIGHYLKNQLETKKKIYELLEYNDSDVRVNHIAVNGNENSEQTLGKANRTLTILIDFDLLTPKDQVTLKVRISDTLGRTSASFIPGFIDSDRYTFQLGKGNHRLVSTIDLPMFANGAHYLDIKLAQRNVKFIGLSHQILLNFVEVVTPEGMLLRGQHNSAILLDGDIEFS